MTLVGIEPLFPDFVVCFFKSDCPSWNECRGFKFIVHILIFSVTPLDESTNVGYENLVEVLLIPHSFSVKKLSWQRPHSEGIVEISIIH